MRKTMISAAVIGTLMLASAPATAQHRGHGVRGDDGIGHQIDQVEDRIRQAMQQRRVSRAEGRQLLARVERLEQRERKYSRNGLSQWERQDLRNRVQNLRQQLRFERKDGRRG